MLKNNFFCIFYKIIEKKKQYCNFALFLGGSGLKNEISEKKEWFSLITNKIYFSSNEKQQIYYHAVILVLIPIMTVSEYIKSFKRIITELILQQMAFKHKFY